MTMHHRKTAPLIGILGFRSPGALDAFVDIAPLSVPLRLGVFVNWRQMANRVMRQDILRTPRLEALAEMSPRSSRGDVFAIHYEALRSEINVHDRVGRLLALVPATEVLHLQYPWPSVVTLREIRRNHPDVTIALHVRIATVLDQDPKRLVEHLAPYERGADVPALDELLIDAAPVGGPGFNAPEDLTREVDVPMVDALLSAARAAYPTLPLGLVGRIPSRRVPELEGLIARCGGLRLIADLSAMAREDEPFLFDEGRAFVQAALVALAKCSEG